MPSAGTGPRRINEPHRIVYKVESKPYRFAIKNITLPKVVIARASSPKQSLAAEIASSLRSSQ
jgi:hypothetical protein